ncbi:hypothetical protein ACFFSY_22515 [Paenibacillus aurantiacus]|uniref:Translation initiation factor 2 n=1 Tax=Paenibacillus aurantiacus TaxID=1936118 RepID=A0ABV5KU02_9BACL
MNRIHDQFKEDSSMANNENLSAKLALIAGAILTFGDFLTTVAAGLALEEAEINENEEQRVNIQREKKLVNMQKKIDDLTHQINVISQQKG